MPISSTSKISEHSIPYILYHHSPLLYYYVVVFEFAVDSLIKEQVVTLNAHVFEEMKGS